MKPPSRNQLCHCGSGKKYKHCCANKSVSPGAPSTLLINIGNGNSLTLPQATQLAIRHHQAGETHNADEIYQKILQIQPNHPDVLHLRGVANHQMGKEDVAYSLIFKAISINPSTPHYYNNLGEVCRAMGRYDEAQSCFVKALSLNTNLPEVHRNQGLLYLDRGQSDQAIAHLQGAIKHFPSYLGNYWALGSVLMHEHKYEEAIATYNQALSICPTDPALLCSKGVALSSKGALNDAIQHYVQAIQLRPKVAELYNNLGLIYQNTGKISEAIACFNKILLFDPKNESAQHLLAALQNTITDRAPASYVRDTFNGYAESFENDLINKLEYRTPAMLAEIFRKSIKQNIQALNILDLGCGTGLFGEQVKNIKKQLIGIDLSQKMINKAEEKKIYDRLIVGDLLEFLSSTESDQFDLVAAVDVFIYIGNLHPVFEHVSRILPPYAWFAFSLEAAQIGIDGFMLDRTGRYQHSSNYIDHLCRQFGFEESGFTRSTLRMDRGKPVEGYLYLLKRLDIKYR